MLYPLTEEPGALQFRAMASGTPVPVKGIATELLVEELLLIVSLPDAAPVAVGSN